MHTQTRKKIKILQDFIDEHYEEWFALHAENITGVRVGKKVSETKEKTYYAIIFHVVEKLTGDSLPDKSKIPTFFEVKFPDRTRIIKTDVIETGAFEFQLGIGNAIQDPPLNQQGSAGLMLRNGNTAYVLTNYHVAAWDLMLNNQFFFDVNNGGAPRNLNINGTAYPRVIGAFGGSLDIGLIAAGPANNFNNNLPGGGSVVNNSIVDVTRLTPQSSVYVFTPHTHPTGYTVNVISNAMPFNTLFRGMVLQKVVCIPRCSTGGDSGSPVLDTSFKIVGIITGADNLHTYVIPYIFINQFFSTYYTPLQII